MKIEIQTGLSFDALEKWGAQAQQTLVLEELAELQVEVAKMYRKKNGSTKEEIIEEMADVAICLGQLAAMLEDETDIPQRLQEKIKEKEDRLKGLIEGWKE